MKILFVDVSPSDYKSEGSQERVRKYQSAIFVSLNRLYPTTMLHDFMSTAVDHELALRYDLLITHLPYDKRTLSYLNALFKLDFILKNYETKVVVYTGASPKDISEEDLKKKGVFEVIRKYDTQEDIASLEKIVRQAERAE